MKQTRKDSLIEAIVNTAIGFLITMIVSPIIYHLIGAPLTWGQMGMSTFYFTIISITRGYLIRRYFNGKIFRVHHKKNIVIDNADNLVIFDDTNKLKVVK